MANVRIFIETTWNRPSIQDGMAMYLVEHMSGNVPITRQGFVHLKDGTETKATLMALINAFHILKKPCSAAVNVTNTTVINTLSNHWLPIWKKDGWKKANGKPVKNEELWQMFLDKTDNHTYTIETGHHEYREIMQMHLREEMEKWEHE